MIQEAAKPEVAVAGSDQGQWNSTVCPFWQVYASSPVCAWQRTIPSGNVPPRKRCSPRHRQYRSTRLQWFVFLLFGPSRSPSCDSMFGAIISTVSGGGSRFAAQERAASQSQRSNRRQGCRRWSRHVLHSPAQQRHTVQSLKSPCRREMLSTMARIALSCRATWQQPPTLLL